MNEPENISELFIRILYISNFLYLPFGAGANYHWNFIWKITTDGKYMLITKSFFVTKKNNTNNYLCTKHLKICALLGTKTNAFLVETIANVLRVPSTIIRMQWQLHIFTLNNSLSRCPFLFRMVRRPQRIYTVNKPIFKQRTTNLFRNWGKGNCTRNAANKTRTHTGMHNKAWQMVKQWGKEQPSANNRLYTARILNTDFLIFNRFLKTAFVLLLLLHIYVFAMHAQKTSVTKA